MDDRNCKEACGTVCEHQVETTIAAGNDAASSSNSESADRSAEYPGPAILDMMDASNEAICNSSGNRPFSEVLKAGASRRAVLAGGLGLVATSFFEPTSPASAVGWGWGASPKPLIGFTPVAVADGTGPRPAISPDYEYQVLIPWGEPLEPGGPLYAGDPNTRPTPAEQELQIGIGHDGMWFFPMDYDCNKHGNFHHYGRNSRKPFEHGMLAINHEFGINPHVLGKNLPANLDDVRLSQHAHGVSVVEIKKIRGKWQQVKSKNARRIHVNTPVKFSGPVAGHTLLKNAAGNEFKGTVNNCANGYTPWGTYLTCEENFDGYFGATGTFAPSAEDKRYGFSTNGFGYGWHVFDERFDLSNPDYANERHRFGWVVEIDPMDAKQTPVKRTALGRFKHEGVGVVEGKGGKVVCYMGDDQAFDYIYKYVSADSWQKMRRRGKSPLDEGKLYVARFNEDGTGNWLELNIANPVLAARFSSQAEVLVYARIAADLLGATPMDRPEWTTIAPNGDVYCTLTNNSGRATPGPANPVAPNPDGHIIKWRDSDEHVGTTFKWQLFIVAASTHGTEDTFSDPDGLWADPDGRLFIETDGGQKDGLNNQLLVADTRTGELRRLFAGVTDDEITGITVTPDRRTMFVNTQHPGNGNPSRTNFPAAQDGVTIPRDCTFVITKKDGGIIGS
jgi:secreted PhoX family phosphatase